MTLLEKRASLLRYDSIHGDFQVQLPLTQKTTLIINGTTSYYHGKHQRILTTAYEIDSINHR
jgi:glyceraldehyde 3-phosphate dehydrogenase